jgi:UDP-glucose:(glucosyl)LPS alpha-1,2-glucosyltransferase
MPIDKNEISVNAKGGTEMMSDRLNSLPADLLDKFQIIPSRIRTLDEKRVRIFWAHDLPNQEEEAQLRNYGWQKFSKLVFVSHWQQQLYINYYKIPWEKTQVLQNAIEPISITPEEIAAKFKDDTIRLIYHTTPHRGLRMLVPVFERLAEEFDNIHLDVYSSFEIYGWSHRDEEFKDVFQKITAHPQMSWHGSKPNSVVREALKKANIFAYPCKWAETSCIALMEAMSAGCMCVHPDYGALPETAANLTNMYTWSHIDEHHEAVFYNCLREAIVNIREKRDFSILSFQKLYADTFYNWDVRYWQWKSFLESLQNEPTDLPKSVGPDAFVYHTR